MVEAVVVEVMGVCLIPVEAEAVEAVVTPQLLLTLFPVQLLIIQWDQVDVEVVTEVMAPVVVMAQVVQIVHLLELQPVVHR